MVSSSLPSATLPRTPSSWPSGLLASTQSSCSSSAPLIWSLLAMAWSLWFSNIELAAPHLVNTREIKSSSLQFFHPCSPPYWLCLAFGGHSANLAEVISSPKIWRRKKFNKPDSSARNSVWYLPQTAAIQVFLWIWFKKQKIHPLCQALESACFCNWTLDFGFSEFSELPPLVYHHEILSVRLIVICRMVVSYIYLGFTRHLLTRVGAWQSSCSAGPSSHHIFTTTLSPLR